MSLRPGGHLAPGANHPIQVLQSLGSPSPAKATSLPRVHRQESFNQIQALSLILPNFRHHTYSLLSHTSISSSYQSHLQGSAVSLRGFVNPALKGVDIQDKKTPSALVLPRILPDSLPESLL